MKTANIGDKVKIGHTTYTIAEIFYAQLFESQEPAPDDGWMIEFKDTNGGYHYWKQYLDGGELIPAATENNTDNNNEEEITMKPNQFTFEGNTYYTNEKGNYFYCIKAGKEKADRIPKDIYDEAKKLHDDETTLDNCMTLLGYTRIDSEWNDIRYSTCDGQSKVMAWSTVEEGLQWVAEQDQIAVDGTTYTYDTAAHTLNAVDEQAELDETPCYVDPMADLQKPAVLNEFGCVDCSGCRVKPCVHRDCMRRNPKNMGGLAECPRLSNGILGEGQKIAEEEGIEPAEAELEANIRKTKKARKARKSKDVAYTYYESDGNNARAKVLFTLTAKQVDFIRHLSDSCFWENGVESALWIDVLCDEIGGQFAGKPMTVGAMVSTLCEKGLASRAKDKVNGHTATYMVLTELGQAVAVDLGLQ